MKKIYLLSAIALLITSCEDNDDSNDCYCTENASCNEVPPTDELCEAYFEMWFYDSSTETCSQIGYSGCEAYGFETQAECEDCANGQ